MPWLFNDGGPSCLLVLADVAEPMSYFYPSDAVFKYYELLVEVYSLRVSRSVVAVSLPLSSARRLWASHTHDGICRMRLHSSSPKCQCSLKIYRFGIFAVCIWSLNDKSTIRSPRSYSVGNRRCWVLAFICRSGWKLRHSTPTLS